MSGSWSGSGLDWRFEGFDFILWELNGYRCIGCTMLLFLVRDFGVIDKIIIYQPESQLNISLLSFNGIILGIYRRDLILLEGK